MRNTRVACEPHDHEKRKILEHCGEKFCSTCKQTRPHTCFWMTHRKSENSDNSYVKEERWNCDRCHAEKIVTKEIPYPTDHTKLFNLLMSLSQKYELQSARISTDYHEVSATFTFPDHDMRKVREIADNWAQRGYVNAKHMLIFEKAGMRDPRNILSFMAPSKRSAKEETMRRVFED